MTWGAIGALIAFALVLVGLNLIPQSPQLAHDLHNVSPVESGQFRTELSNLLGPPVVDGNAVQAFNNGDEIFPAMLEAIRGARKSINFETYIYWSGEVSRRFVEALGERARAGIPVHVLVDWVGASRMDEGVVEELRAAGVRFEKFHPLTWYTLDRINNRTHRKLLIVDGRVGFTGGVGIADEWDGNADRPDRWRDMQFRVEGPVAAQFQAAFEDNWITSTGEVSLGPDYYPPPEQAGGSAAQLFSSSPDGGSENMQLMYLMAINGARRSIDLEAAYFLPDELTLRALQAALTRGVKVRIVVPGPHGDSPWVATASQAQWGAVLQHGARLFRFQPSMFHTKMMIVDDYLTIVGSANFDNRSFRLNDESNLNVYDHEFGARMRKVVDADIARSREVTLEEWRRRGWFRRATEWLAALPGSQF
ncbi:MAG: cardiolipin synthase B [Xanthomonadales bacterium]|nr:cardiolipin synthase B [Xanthomonadales bacterium]